MRRVDTTRTDTAQLSTSQLLSIAANLVTHAWNRRLSPLGVSHAAVVTLEELDAAGPVRQVDLIPRLQITGQTLGRMLRNLEERGLVSRATGINGDDRQILVTITAQGTDLLMRAKDIEAAFEASEGQPVEELRADLLTILNARLADR
ncbi:MAG: MarR family transcriptional regulator [Micrococcaceae bacterium]|jgi:DNA-binding MarR family transcriptional regulator|nr:MarR family transcriptional regulator [Micrococcaceae bacterium]